MAVLADFTVINKSVANTQQNGTFAKPYLIGDNLSQRFTVSFNTGGLHHSPGLLTMMVRELTRGTARVAIILPNQEVEVGRLSPSSEADRSIWRQQQFIIQTNILRDGNNTLMIGRVQDNLAGGGQFDDFQVSAIACFFHQES